MSLGHGASIVQSGLVLHLDAANRKSYPGTGTAWKDLSGNGNDGTLVNGTSFDVAGYLSFDGVDDSFTAPISCNKTYYSLEWWFYPKTRINYNQTIMFGDWGTFIWHTGANGQYWVGTDLSTRINDVDPGSVELNKWQNWVWTFDNGLGKIYKNSTLLRQKTMNISPVSEFTTIFSSSLNTGSTNGFRSVVKVYSNKVLNAAEIKQNFEAARGRYDI